MTRPCFIRIRDNNNSGVKLSSFFVGGGGLFGSTNDKICFNFLHVIHTRRRAFKNVCASARHSDNIIYCSRVIVGQEESGQVSIRLTCSSRTIVHCTRYLTWHYFSTRFEHIGNIFTTLFRYFGRLQ